MDISNLHCPAAFGDCTTGLLELCRVWYGSELSLKWGRYVISGSPMLAQLLREYHCQILDLAASSNILGMFMSFCQATHYSFSWKSCVCRHIHISSTRSTSFSELLLIFLICVIIIELERQYSLVHNLTVLRGVDRIILGSPSGPHKLCSLTCKWSHKFAFK